jgi:DNA-binding MarR family transcriptional regulator
MDSASLAGLVAEVALRLQRRLRQEPAVHGLTEARLATLKRVVADGRSTVGNLAAAEGVASPTMSRIVDGLEAEKLVLRRRSSRDRRVVEVVATTLGRTLASSAERRQLRWLERALQQLNERDRRAIAEVAATLARIQDELGVTDE